MTPAILGPGLTGHRGWGELPEEGKPGRVPRPRPVPTDKPGSFCRGDWHKAAPRLASVYSTRPLSSQRWHATLSGEDTLPPEPLGFLCDSARNSGHVCEPKSPVTAGRSRHGP